jgi:di/tripeptidase
MKSEEYVDLLLKNSEEEDLIWKKINEENEKFEQTEAYVKHRKILDGYYKELRKETEKRFAEAKEVRKEFRSPVKPTTKKVEREPDSEELKKCLELYKGLSKSEKFRFGIIAYERDDVKMQKTVSTHKDIRDLQNVLVQAVIDFVNDRKLTDIEEVSFGMDNVQSSAEYGEWVPATDSSINAYGFEWNDEHQFQERRLIDTVL